MRTRQRQGRWVAATLVVVLAALALWSSRARVPTVRLADGLEVRCLNASAWPTVGPNANALPLTVAAHEVPEIEVVSRRPLSALTLEFESRSAAGLEIEGGSLTQTILRPDGRVLFTIALEDGETHRRWWLLASSFRYRLKWVMPDAPGGPLELTLSAEPENL